MRMPWREQRKRSPRCVRESVCPRDDSEWIMECHWCATVRSECLTEVTVIDAPL